MTFEYKDFLVYNLELNGEFNELDIAESDLKKYMDPEEVLLIVRQDLRRLYIWKGPRSPVRKRFISSRVASQIQEDARKNGGRHLKIVSVDAGDEPIEFLSAFNLDPMEIGAEDKLEDMRYIRNIDKQKAREEEYKRRIEEKKKKQKYKSPLELEAEAQGKLDASASTAAKSSSSSISSGSAASVGASVGASGNSSMGLAKARPPIRKRYSESYSEPAKTMAMAPVSKEEADKVIDTIVKTEPPLGYSRMNIIIGNNLYTPQISKSVVLGKEVEKEEWALYKDLPKGTIDVELNMLRLFVSEDQSTIKAIEIYKKNGQNQSSKTKKSKNDSPAEKKQKKSSKKTSKRKLPSIPGA